MALQQRELLLRVDNVSQGDILRRAIALLGTPGGRETFLHLQRLELEVAGLQRRLEEEGAARAKAQAALEKHLRKGHSQLQSLRRHLPRVRELVAQGFEIPSGIAGLDQLWHNAGRRWRDVLARLEAPSPAPPPPDRTEQNTGGQ